MIVYEGEGNILNSERQTLLCTTNVAGAMGAGVAKAFKERYPDLHSFYMEKFPREYFPKPSRGLELYTFPINDTQQCLLFPTKIHWRNPSPWKLMWENLAQLASNFEELGITSLAMPPIGCGNGGWQYRNIRAAIHHHLGPLPIEVDVLFG